MHTWRTTCEPEDGQLQVKKKSMEEVVLSQPLEGSIQANSLILDLQPLELSDTFMLFKPPGLWHFVTAALAHKYRLQMKCCVYLPVCGLQQKIIKMRYPCHEKRASTCFVDQLQHAVRAADHEAFCLCWPALFRSWEMVFSGCPCVQTKATFKCYVYRLLACFLSLIEWNA